MTKGLHFQRFYIDEDWSLNDEDLKEDWVSSPVIEIFHRWQKRKKIHRIEPKTTYKELVTMD